MFDKSYNILINISDDTPVFHTPQQLIITSVSNQVKLSTKTKTKSTFMSKWWVEMLSWHRTNVCEYCCNVDLHQCIIYHNNCYYYNNSVIHRNGTRVRIQYSGFIIQRQWKCFRKAFMLVCLFLVSEKSRNIEIPDWYDWRWQWSYLIS